MSKIHITKSNQGQHLLVGADVATIKAWSQDTGGSMLVFENVVAAGGGPPTLHRHGYSEMFYFLDGVFEVSTLDDAGRLQIFAVEAGDTVVIPSMVWHNFKNVGSTRGRFLAVHTPPAMETLIHEIGLPLDDPLNPPTPNGSPSAEERERFMSLIGQYMELLPPEAIAR